MHFMKEIPPDSFSRQLDVTVQAQEMPYGYSNTPPASDHENPSSIQEMKHPKDGRRG